MEKFVNKFLGQYEVKINTKRGKMTATLFYKEGRLVPQEIHGKFRKNGKTYIYWEKFPDINSFLFDLERNKELFQICAEDMKKKCEDFRGKWRNLVNSSSALLIHTGNSKFLLPNPKFGTVVYDCGMLSSLKCSEMRILDFKPVMDLYSGEMTVMTDSENIKITGVAVIFQDNHGNFAVARVREGEDK